MTHDFERSATDRIYESCTNIANDLRRIAEDIDRSVATAKENEGTTEDFRVTVEDLPADTTKRVMWGLANAHLDTPARLLENLHEIRAAQREVAAKPIADRMRAFSAAHKRKTPHAGESIFTYITMDGPEDARYEVTHTIDTDLLDTTADLLDPKGA